MEGSPQSPQSPPETAPPPVPPAATPQAPSDAPPAQPSTEELLQELVGHQREQRAEIASLREELARTKAPAPPAPTSQVRSQEELLAERMSLIEQHPYYCPGCGRLFDYQRECAGSGAAPHAPIDVISTDELKSGDSAKHTAAPGAAA